MERRQEFQNYDEEEVYQWAQDQAIDPGTLNFVVEFDQNESSIAFDLSAADINQLCNESRGSKKRVRWINLWSPHLQQDIINILAAQYWFPEALTSVMCSAPPRSGETESFHQRHFRLRRRHTDDVELRNSSTKTDTKTAHEEDNHYIMAQDMINYQSIHVGQNFLCVGANFMHSVTSECSRDETLERLWSWIILADNGMIITLEEQPFRFDPGRAQIIGIRAHATSIFSQLSKQGFPQPGSASILSLRSQNDPVHYVSWASSDLFYYLFDHWHTTYMSVVSLQRRVDTLSDLIISGLASQEDGDYRSRVVRLLYDIGKRLRLNRQLYDGYLNLINDVLKSFDENRTDVELSIDAKRRFEYLQGRLRRLILGSTDEADREKASLINTYFSITSQQDSKTMARTSRAIVFTAKLAVLFLPVMLMTSYFSVNLADLQGVYTVTTYWATFAVVSGLSCIALFFVRGRLVNKCIADVKGFINRRLYSFETD